MTVKAEDLQQYLNKRVTLHVNDPEDSSKAIELEGKVEAASPAGIAFKEKGKSSVDLYGPSDIYEIDLAPEPEKKIRQKRLDPVEEGRIRQHLVDRHGMPVSKANAIDEAAAKELHDKIDHADLGHKHAVAEKSSQESAIEAAEDDAA